MENTNPVVPVRVMTVMLQAYEHHPLVYAGPVITDEEIIKVLERRVHEEDADDQDEYIQIITGQQVGSPVVNIWEDGDKVKEETRFIRLDEHTFPVKTSYYEPPRITEARKKLKRLTKERRQAMKRGDTADVLFELSKPIDALAKTIADFEESKKLNVQKKCKEGGI